MKAKPPRTHMKKAQIINTINSKLATIRSHVGILYHIFWNQFFGRGGDKGENVYGVGFTKGLGTPQLGQYIAFVEIFLLQVGQGFNISSI